MKKNYSTGKNLFYRKFDLLPFLNRYLNSLCHLQLQKNGSVVNVFIECIKMVFVAVISPKITLCQITET